MNHTRIAASGKKGSRVLRYGALVALTGSLQGCVAAKHYEEARSVAEAETSAHARTQARLAAAMKRMHELEADLAAREKAIAESESAAAEAKLDSTVAVKEKEAQALLVEQLRSELARTGDHLSVYSRDKRELQQTLLLAEERLKGAELAEKNFVALVGAARDLAIGLESELEQKRVELGAKQGRVVVTVTAGELFAADGDALSPTGESLLAAIAKTGKRHPALRVIVAEPECAPHAAERSARIGSALRDGGLPDARVTLPVRAEAKPRPAPAPAPEGSLPATEPEPNAEAPAAVRGGDEQPSGTLPPSVDSSTLRYEFAFSP